MAFPRPLRLADVSSRPNVSFIYPPTDRGVGKTYPIPLSKGAAGKGPSGPLPVRLRLTPQAALSSLGTLDERKSRLMRPSGRYGHAVMTPRVKTGIPSAALREPSG